MLKHFMYLFFVYQKQIVKDNKSRVLWCMYFYFFRLHQRYCRFGQGYCVQFRIPALW